MPKPRKKSTTTLAPERAEEMNDFSPQSDGHAVAPGPEREQIARRAFELYEARGASDGGALDDWLEAERELIGSTADRKRD